jgi:hypothetical protein
MMMRALMRESVRTPPRNSNLNLICEGDDESVPCCLPNRAKYRKLQVVGDCNASKMSLRIPQTSSPGAAAGGAKKLLVVGLCGEAIKVEWLPEDTVGAVKDKAYSAAANTLLADGSRCSLVQGSRR